MFTSIFKRGSEMMIDEMIDSKKELRKTRNKDKKLENLPPIIEDEGRLRRLRTKIYTKAEFKSTKKRLEED